MIDMVLQSSSFHADNFQRSWISKLWWEIRLNWKFIRRDIPATVVPSAIFSLAALLQNVTPTVESHLLPVGLSLGAIALGKTSVFVWLCLTFFCISNQLVGLEEDRKNKPDRPLVSGLLSANGAIVRLILAGVGVVFLGWLWGVAAWALSWLGLTILHNQLKLSQHWVGKSGLTALLILTELAAGWEIVTPLTSFAWGWIGLVVFAWLVVGHFQDLRDIEGDLATGRQTLPIAIGEIPTRWYLCLGSLLLPLVSHALMLWAKASFWHIAFWDMILAGMCIAIAWRVIQHRSSQADRQTYLLFTYWSCAAISSACFLPL
jgi:4-hydroxybenzoate polyprenyltransferase